MLLDDLLPHFDATRIETRVIDGAIEDVYARVLDADFLRAWRENALVRALFAVRGAAERAGAAVRGESTEPAPAPPRMALADMTDEGEWVRLGENPPHEICFGAIGRFWAGETEWRHIRAEEFAAFAAPGFARIGCSLSLRPYGDTRTLVSYEARTQATDARSRAAFLRYWAVVSPGVGVVMRSLLAVVERTASATPARQEV